MVSAHEIEFCLLDEFPDLGTLEVVDFVLVRGGQMRHHAAVVTGDYYAASSCGDFGVDEVFGAQTGGGTGGTQDVGVFVGADTADVED